MSRPAVFLQPQPAVRLRPARSDDLDALNDVIERAVMTWNLAERVKRLSLPSYRYHAHDQLHLHIVVAADASGAIVGVAAWEPASPRDLPADMRGLLLQELYVDPAHVGRGIGSQLLDTAAAAACAQGFDGPAGQGPSRRERFFRRARIAACGRGRPTARLSASLLAARAPGRSD
jgi:predicted N-acetyltransferase YhbS